MDPTSPEATASGVRPRLGIFGQRTFVVIWFGYLIVMIGVAMYDTAAGWMILNLDPDPRAVSLLRAATTLPMFLVTLPAGAIADIVDSRRLLIIVSYAIAALIAAFGVLVALRFIDTPLLLVNTLLLSAALSLSAPAWLAIAPRLVDKEKIPGFMAANAVGYNLSRAVGPALGGLAISQIGIGAPFWFAVFANLAVAAALLWWKPPAIKTSELPAEQLTSAVRTGLRHAFNNRLFRTTLVRTLAIYPFAAAYWGLLPLVAKHVMDSPGFYGVLLSAISVGGILGSVAQRMLRTRAGDDEILALGAFGTSFALLLFAFAHDIITTISACLIAGAVWVMILSILYAAAERALPAWVRARGLAVFLTVVYGAMTLGSAAWGLIAKHVSLDHALVFAAAGALAGVSLTWRWRMNAAAPVDLSPSMHWRTPRSTYEIENNRGPVLVKLGYLINPENRAQFLRAMDELGIDRKRDGAFAWGIFEDAAEVGRYEETYLIESWLELQHLPERVTNADRILEEEIRQMLVAPPKIEFLVAAAARHGKYFSPPVETKA